MNGSLETIGILQIYDSVRNGYWHARSLTFVLGDLVHVLGRARLQGDALVIVGGTLPPVHLAFRAVLYPKSATKGAAPTTTPLFTQAGESRK